MNQQLIRYLYAAIGLINVSSWVFFDGAYNNFTKPLLMPILMLYLYECFRDTVVLNTLLIFVALVFSWIGDLALMNADYFLPGVGSFLIAQLLYTRLFFGFKTAWKSWVNWKSALIILYGAGLLWHLLPAAGSLMLPVGLYGMTLLTMSMFAVNSSSEYKKEYLMGAIGAIFFVLSDSMIAIDKFLTSFDHRNALIMSTYILAQYLLVEGLTLKSKA